MSAGKEEEETFATFRGYGYVSMFFGIPLAPLLALFAFGLFGGLVACLMFGGWGAIVPGLCAATLLFLKVLCETDNKAMEKAKWKFKSWWLRLKLGSTIISVLPNKVASKDDRFRRCLKKILRSQ